MNPYILIYNSIGITWFILLTLVSIVISNFMIRGYAKKIFINKISQGEKEKESPMKKFIGKIEDIFYIVIISGFIGARLGYVLYNYDLFSSNLFYIVKLTHMNLNLIGGIISGVFVLFLLSKKYKIPFKKLWEIYIVPFYFSMSIGVWSMYFDGSLIGKEFNGLFSMKYMGQNRYPVVVYLSILFLIGVIFESVENKKIKNQYISYVLFGIIILVYYIIKFIFSM